MKYLHKKVNNDDPFNKYIDLIEQNNYKSSKVMLLVPRTNLLFNYKNKVDIPFNNELRIVTYTGFVKKEIVKYWPLIVDKCEDIKRKSVSPVFVNNNLCDYMLISKVDEMRINEGYFSDITATSRSIASSIKLNIEKSSYNLIDFKSIGERIYNSKKNRDILERFSFSQMDEIIDYYVETLLSNSMLDNALSVYLYNKYLLEDSFYLERLCKEIDYLIVDSLEVLTSAEVDFIERITTYVKEIHLFNNGGMDYSLYNNADFKYIDEKLLKKDIIGYEGIQRQICLADLKGLGFNIDIYDSSQLYNQMINEVAYKISVLIDSGEIPEDIVVISPIVNETLDIKLKSMLSKNHIGINNTKLDRKLIDYPYVNALYVAACILVERMDYIKEEEYINFLEVTLSTNQIEARKIYERRRETSNQHLGYLSILDYINSNKRSGIELYEFLIKFYVEKLLNLKYGKENVKICKQIIHESKSFCESVEMLGMNTRKSKEEIFLESFKMVTKDFYSISNTEEIKESKEVVLTTPYTYISYQIDRPIQIWVDIGSNMWSTKVEKEISNLVVLRKSYANQIFTKEIEESFKNYYLFNMIYNVAKSAKDIYAFKSEYSVNGYVQESYLHGILMKIMSGKEDNLE